MAVERWGALSVADHKEVADLVANILLYDGIVLPVMTNQVDRNERAYWHQRAWDPDLQSERIRQLGDLAVVRPWDARRRHEFKRRLQQVTPGGGATYTDLMGITRNILAGEKVSHLPPGVSRAHVIPAYNSLVEFQDDYRIESADDHLSAQALLLTRRLAVPNCPDAEDVLAESIRLSLSENFREKRQALFEWQYTAAQRGLRNHLKSPDVA